MTQVESPWIPQPATYSLTYLTIRALLDWAVSFLLYFSLFSSLSSIPSSFPPPSSFLTHLLCPCSLPGIHLANDYHGFRAGSQASGWAGLLST